MNGVILMDFNFIKMIKKFLKMSGVFLPNTHIIFYFTYKNPIICDINRCLNKIKQFM